MPFNIVAIGEVLWDLLPSGKQMGGAPANFVGHAAALGANATLISRVGNDPLGREILEKLARHKVVIDAVGIDNTLPTGTVSVEVATDGQPKFTIEPNSAWDAIDDGYKAIRAVEAADAVCFGTLAQRDERSRRNIATLLDYRFSSALAVLDINLRPPFTDAAIIGQSLRRANILKLNHQELPIILEAAEIRATSVTDQLRQLTDRFHFKLIALTCGDAGSLLYAATGEIADHAGIKTNVVDAVGAGDAFTAAVVIGYLRKWPLERISDEANRLAAYVCSQSGATPVLPPEILSRWQ